MSVDRKVAMAILNEVQEKVDQYLGTQIAAPMDPDGYDPERDSFCKEYVKQCELAEKKTPDDQEVLFRSNLLKAQLYGCWQKIISSRDVRKKAKKCYDRLLEIAPDKDSEALARYHYALFCRTGAIGFCGKEDAIEHFKRVIELVGEDSELGIECAKELAKEQEKKGVCFIATAVYGSYSAPEVLLLRSFRDRVLLLSTAGCLFIRLYYRLSPPVAKIIGRNSLLKQLVRNAILRPIVRIVRSRLD